MRRQAVRRTVASTAIAAAAYGARRGKADYSAIPLSPEEPVRCAVKRLAVGAAISRLERQRSTPETQTAVVRECARGPQRGIPGVQLENLAVAVTRCFWR